ncbi:ANTAR domain-containing response regulator [Streptomyces sp. JHA26]|uniref:ANTAR domain-containing response regulator n=1 Tax=Streptomyces sp. JHA26 TaxID=1917143 RepID=UPI000989B2A6|nr:ANTAR domain-containing protein [Streptomyces sp. JHA26]
MTSAAPPRLTGRPAVLVIDGRVEAGRALLVPRGELVHGCADTLAEALDALPAEVERIDLDMGGVVFMDTAGLQFLELLRGHGEQWSVPVTARNWTGQPRRVLELLGPDAAAPPRGTPRPPAQEPARSAVAAERSERLRVLQEEVEQLRQAIASRPVIDQARGVLMALHGCTPDEAWHILREASQLSNTKLRTVAAAVTAGTRGDGPPPPPEVRAALRTALERAGR